MTSDMRIRACDADRLEGFLNSTLSVAQELEFTMHLNTCEDCRESLERQAAAPGDWQEARQMLKLVVEPRFEEGDADGPSSRRPLQIQNVLDALGPTDDPAMLGRLGGYEVSGIVGSGGMGVVLKAIDKSLERTVAIKVLAPHLATSGAARKRFAREAKAAAAVLHPNVIAIHSVSNDEALPYLVMPYVRGSSLQKRLDAEGPLPLVEVLRIGAQIAAGLAAAHAQGLVHRDIKPANILLEDGVERVTITDFGLARAVDDASITHTGMIAGTPQYMSPEQARGEPVDQRSDLFSLGSVLYAACTGRSPFRAETTYGVMRQITDAEPADVRTVNPAIPAWLNHIISRLMSKQRDLRFQSSREVAELLEECLAHVQQPKTVALPAQLRQRVRLATGFRSLWDSRRWVAVGVLGLGLMLAGVVILLESNKGTVRIESDTDDVTVRVVKGEEVVKTLTVTKKDNSVRVAAGEYVVEIAGESDGVTVLNGEVHVQRGGVNIVKIVRTPPIAQAATDPTTAVLFGPRTPAPSRRDADEENQKTLAAMKDWVIAGDMLHDLQTSGKRLAVLRVFADGRVVRTGKNNGDPLFRKNIGAEAVKKLVAELKSKATLRDLSSMKLMQDEFPVQTADEEKLKATLKSTADELNLGDPLPARLWDQDAHRITIRSDGKVYDLLSLDPPHPERPASRRPKIAPLTEEISQKLWGMVGGDETDKTAKPDGSTSAAEPKVDRRFATSWRVESIAISADGRYAAVPGGQHAAPKPADWIPVIEILDLEGGKLVLSFKLTTSDEDTMLAKLDRVHPIDVTALAFSPDGSRLAIGTRMGQVKLFDPRTGELQQTLFDGPGQAADDKTPENLKPFKRALGTVNSLAFSPDGTLLVSCGGSFEAFPLVPEEAERSLGRSVTGPGRLKVWDLATGSIKHDLVGHSHASAAAFSPDGKLLASAGNWEDSSGHGTGLILWDPSSGEKRLRLDVPTNGFVPGVSFSPDGKLVAVPTLHFDKDKDRPSGKLTLAHAATGLMEWQTEFSTWVSAPLFTTNGTSLLVLRGDNMLEYLDPQTGKPRRQIRAQNFAPGSNWNCLAGKSGTVVIGGMGSGRGSIDVWRP